MANATVKASRLRPVVKGEKSDVVNLIWAGRNTSAHKMFKDKTLSQVAEEYDLWDEDVKFGYSNNPKTGEEIKHLTIMIEGDKYVIPFSIGANADELDNLDECNNWLFRVNYMRKKGEDGKPLGNDADGNVIVDETAPYLSFGRAAGFTLEREEAAFTPIEEEPVVTAKAAVAAPKARR